MRIAMLEDGTRPKSHRGFAAMSPEKRREIAKLGGAAARRLSVDLMLAPLRCIWISAIE